MEMLPEFRRLREAPPPGSRLLAERAAGTSTDLHLHPETAPHPETGPRRERFQAASERASPNGEQPRAASRIRTAVALQRPMPGERSWTGPADRLPNRMIVLEALFAAKATAVYR